MTAPPDSAPETRRLGLDPALARAVAESIDAGAAEDAVARVLALTPTDAARLIETLGAPERQALVEAARGRLDPEILSELDEDVRDEVVELLGPARTGRALGELDTDDAVEVIQGLDEDVQEEVLESVPAAARADLEESLSYP
ncbi:MAG: magnesium transporter MgtE N-terminal domain-containing protein, partial [Alphaproteobacteria bacterium]